MHLIGGARLLQANRGRTPTHQRALGNPKVKLALTAGALGATTYARLLGQKVIDAGDVPLAEGTEPSPLEVAKAQKQLKALQWAIPGLTGAVLASSSLHEDQQRPSEIVKDQLKKLPGLAATAAGTAGTLASTGAKKAADKVREAVPA